MLSETKNITPKQIEKRDKIIEAAAQLFSGKNYHEVMMEDVAKLASIAKGTLYNYFESKEDLYFSIMVLRMQNLILSLKQKFNGVHNPVTSLHGFIIHNFMFLLKYKCFFLMLQKENLNASNNLCVELKQKRDELKQIVIDILKAGKNLKIFRQIDEDLFSDLIISSINTAVGRTISNNFDEEKISKEKELLFDFTLKGLVNPENNLTLHGKNIVITRSAEDSKDSAQKFIELGANVISFPTIDFIDVPDYSEFYQAIKNLDQFDILIFTSPNSVKIFFEKLNEKNIKVDLSKIKVAAVGKKTSEELEKRNLNVDVIPSIFNAKELVEELQNQNLITGKKILIPCSKIAREELPSLLKENGAEVFRIPIYDIGFPPEEIIQKNLEKLDRFKTDLIIFTSPSTFNNFISLLNLENPENYFEDKKVAAIGTTTKSAIENFGINVDILPEEFSMEGLIKSVVEFYQKIER